MIIFFVIQWEEQLLIARRDQTSERDFTRHDLISIGFFIVAGPLVEITGQAGQSVTVVGFSLVRRAASGDLFNQTLILGSILMVAGGSRRRRIDGIQVQLVDGRTMFESSSQGHQSCQCDFIFSQIHPFQLRSSSQRLGQRNDPWARQSVLLESQMQKPTVALQSRWNESNNSFVA